MKEKINSSLYLSSIDTALAAPREQTFLKTRVFYGSSHIFIYPLEGEDRKVFLYIAKAKLSPFLNYELTQDDLEKLIEYIEVNWDLGEEIFIEVLAEEAALLASRSIAIFPIIPSKDDTFFLRKVLKEWKLLTSR